MHKYSFFIVFIAILSNFTINCQITANPCVTGPCRNGGTCTVLTSTQYQCSCQLGYSGNNCETYSTACDNNPCGVGGLCNFKADGSSICFCLSKLRSFSLFSVIYLTYLKFFCNIEINSWIYRNSLPNS